METAGNFSEEADFMAQLLGNYYIPNASFWHGNENDIVVEDEEMNTSSMFSFLNNNGLMGMDFCMFDCKSNLMEGNDFLNHDAEQPVQEYNNISTSTSNKRHRLLGEAQRSKKLKKSVKVDENYDSNKTTTLSSEDVSNASHEANGVDSSSRASRGSATDPQSLYARKRRERINERLRILQNLVPNGTKVDLSTMLEEAVQYVKFLQLQIKLLSSEDMWMYAPIAYNGMDIGLDFKIPSPKPQSS